jgi:hypothetical protein
VYFLRCLKVGSGSLLNNFPLYLVLSVLKMCNPNNDTRLVVLLINTCPQIQWFLIFHVEKCYLILVALAKKKIE